MPSDLPPGGIAALREMAYKAGWEAAITLGLKAMREREQDLRWCNKDDDCHTEARGVALAIDDFEYAVGLESWEGFKDDAVPVFGSQTLEGHVP